VDLWRRHIFDEPFAAKDFTSPGTYTALLTLTDTNGNWRAGSVDVAVHTTYNSWAQKNSPLGVEQHETFPIRRRTPDAITFPISWNS